MNIIRHNPFRILGLLSNATERELQKQIGIIKRYSEVGKVKSFNYDFEVIGPLNRTPNEIQQASNKIEQSHKKLHYSLFWFIGHTTLDEIALNNLKDRNIEKSIDIWDKSLKNEVTSKNFSSYLNLSTLYLAVSTSTSLISLHKLKRGMLLKGQLIHSKSFNDLSKHVMRSEIIMDPIETSKSFADEIIELLKKYLNKNGGISTHDLISLFDSYPQNIQKYVSAKFTETPFSNIETKIEKTLTKRKNNPNDAEEYGEELYKSTKSDLLLLKKLLGENNVQYKMLANKLANEVMQCSIDFFNEFRDYDDFDPGDDAVKVAKYAKSIVPIGQIKDRIDENLSVMQDWVNDEPAREREKVISEDVNFITSKLEDFQQQVDSIENSRQLVSDCESKLLNIKNQLGSYDDFYLKLSSAIINNALGMLITVVNREQDQLEYDKTKLTTLPGTFSSAVSVLIKMKSFDMTSKIRDRLNTNTKVITDINSQLKEIKNQPAAQTGACYIATMAYGDYNHPKVMVLRKFRDEQLSRNIFGRSFIKIYYKLSPYLVLLLKDSVLINRMIRNMLDKFVNKVGS